MKKKKSKTARGKGAPCEWKGSEAQKAWLGYYFGACADESILLLAKECAGVGNLGQENKRQNEMG